MRAATSVAFSPNAAQSAGLRAVDVGYGGLAAAAAEGDARG
jgi:hypothetical protein